MSSTVQGPWRKSLLTKWHRLRWYECLAAVIAAMAIAFLAVTFAVMGVTTLAKGPDAQLRHRTANVASCSALMLLAPAVSVLYTTFKRWRAYDPAAQRIGWHEWLGVLSTAAGIGTALAYFPAYEIAVQYVATPADLTIIFGPALSFTLCFITCGLLAQSEARNPAVLTASRPPIAQLIDWSYAPPLLGLAMVVAPFSTSC